MFWKISKFQKTLPLLAFIFILFYGCQSSNTKETNKKQKINHETLSRKELVKRKVESFLKIKANEKYTIQIIFKQLNRDTLKDAIVLVNRKEFAYEVEKKKGKLKFFNQMGNTGKYNYVFVLMGGQEDLLSANPDAIGSNVNYPLTLHFLNLTSPTRTDFYVNYRIRNSLHRNYYTVKDNKLYIVFSCPIFDKIGDKHPVVYKPVIKNSSVRSSKDIALMHGKIVDYSLGGIEDLYHYRPKKIIATDSLVAYFILNHRTMKYVTPMKPLAARKKK